MLDKHITPHVVRTHETTAALLEAKEAAATDDPDAKHRWEDAREEHMLAWAQRTSVVQFCLNIKDTRIATSLIHEA